MVSHNLSWLLLSHQTHLQRVGCRRLIVLSGAKKWVVQQQRAIQHSVSGDWIECTPNVLDNQKSLPLSRVRSILGNEYLHACFDATTHFDLEALAILAGALKAGSWLVVLAPPWECWQHCVDLDSLRWSDTSQAIQTPHFVQYLQKTLLADPDVIIWRQGQTLTINRLSINKAWDPPDGAPTVEQTRLLQRLANVAAGQWVLNAARGRGKSALAGMLIHACHQQQQSVWFVAPNKHNVSSVAQYAQTNILFWAPDALLAYCQTHPVKQVNWLIIDEAAAIPGPLIEKLVSYFNKTLLLTTTEGYEGTGKGFLLKLCTKLPDYHALTLNTPIRWAKGDALERIIDHLCLFFEPQLIEKTVNRWSIVSYTQTELANDFVVLRQFYLLLTSAHYRTRPLDLRRLMDAPGMSYFLCFDYQQQVIGGVWCIQEGNLDKHLSQQIWQGKRRPRGNLVSQSLAAHTIGYQAPMLSSIRITRIAVYPVYQRSMIGTKLINQVVQQAVKEKQDYLSVSFGFTQDLWQFWQQCGFILLRVGTRKEAVSGCYTAMAIYPLTEPGHQLASRTHQHLMRNLEWFTAEIKHTLAIPSRDYTDLTLQDSDWQELAGFAFAKRTFAGALAALYRLSYHFPQQMPYLALFLRKKYSMRKIITHHSLSGQKGLEAIWRQEVSTILHTVNKKVF